MSPKDDRRCERLLLKMFAEVIREIFKTPIQWDSEPSIASAVKRSAPPRLTKGKSKGMGAPR